MSDNGHDQQMAASFQEGLRRHDAEKEAKAATRAAQEAAAEAAAEKAHRRQGWKVRGGAAAVGAVLALGAWVWGKIDQSHLDKAKEAEDKAFTAVQQNMIRTDLPQNMQTDLMGKGIPEADAGKIANKYIEMEHSSTTQPQELVAKGPSYAFKACIGQTTGRMDDPLDTIKLELGKPGTPDAITMNFVQVLPGAPAQERTSREPNCPSVSEHNRVTLNFGGPKPGV